MICLLISIIVLLLGTIYHFPWLATISNRPANEIYRDIWNLRGAPCHKSHVRSGFRSLRNNLWSWFGCQISIPRKKLALTAEMARPRCFFDISIGGQNAGRIIMEVMRIFCGELFRFGRQFIWAWHWVLCKIPMCFSKSCCAHSYSATHAISHCAVFVLWTV